MLFILLGEATSKLACILMHVEFAIALDGNREGYKRSSLRNRERSSLNLLAAEDPECSFEPHIVGLNRSRQNHSARMALGNPSTSERFSRVRSSFNFDARRLRLEGCFIECKMAI